MTFEKIKIRVILFLLYLLINIPSNVLAEEPLFIIAQDKQLLGCMNCNEYDKYSIWNKYGDYGSKYSSTSIWNNYGSYGGKYSQYSPFNQYTDLAPKILDAKGNFYGYLTSNKYKSERANMTELVSMILSVGSNSSY